MKSYYALLVASQAEALSISVGHFHGYSGAFQELV